MKADKVTQYQVNNAYPSRSRYAEKSLLVRGTEVTVDTIVRSVIKKRILIAKMKVTGKQGGQ